MSYESDIRELHHRCEEMETEIRELKTKIRVIDSHLSQDERDISALDQIVTEFIGDFNERILAIHKKIDNEIEQIDHIMAQEAEDGGALNYFVKWWLEEKNYESQFMQKKREKFEKALLLFLKSELHLKTEIGEMYF